MSEADLGAKMPTADDPSANPVLLPPRTRADAVQDRPAGGSAEEVAAANPALAAAVPATVGKTDAPGAGAEALLAAADAAGDGSNAGARASFGGQHRGSEGAAAAVGEETGGGAAAAGVGAGGLGVGVDMTDGSGMEVLELAVQEGWTH
ncbi:hypothetical protein OEZ85_009442 [Tetradesmus obliquus]|uniref:Uncharacterized protein n=1 Tax=Tetradesmus obliquus TaxID=3088 RepID=A0ABY8U8Z5_TETOB|nr:hypothetical protein OEZ85_009442 [Tetradesmus obliquus]